MVVNFLYPTLSAPSLNVTIIGRTATAGSIRTLACMATGVDLSVAGTTAMYTWRRGGVTLQGPRPNAEYTISTVGVSDAGDDYICEATVTASYLDLTGSISASGSGTLYVQCK